MARRICVQPCPPTVTTPEFTIPMMGSIKAVSDFTLKGGCDGCELIGNMMMQISPVMGSMGMPLCLMGCVGAVLNVLNEIPDAITQLDVTGLVQAIADLGPKCACVLEFALPPPAGFICGMLKMVRDVVVAISMAVTCSVGLMSHLLSLSAKASVLLTSTNPETQAAGECLQARVQTLSDSLSPKMEPVQLIFLMAQPIFDLLAALIPPPFSDVIQDIKDGLSAFGTDTPQGTPPAEVLDALTALSDVMSIASQAFVTIVQVCP